MLLAIPLIVFGGQSLALDIVLTDIAASGSDPDAVAAFEVAAEYWESVLTDDVTVRIAVSFENLGSGTLGSTSLESVGTSYGTVRDALGTDATSAADTSAVGNLETEDSLAMVTNDPDVSGGWDYFENTDSAAINTNLYVSRANLKAVGLLADDGSNDATVKLNSYYSYDFDNSDGIDSGHFDFVGIAIHEIGHALGFVSGVDAMDTVSEPSGPLRLDYTTAEVYNSILFNTLDLFRYSDVSVDFGETVLGDWTVDPFLDWGFGNGSIGDSYFSLDGGATALGPFSEGAYNGDGDQASHWEDNLGLGVMDPTTAAGEWLSVTALDMLAFDAIGWDLYSSTPIPEPATVLLVGSGLLGLLARRKWTVGTRASV